MQLIKLPLLWLYVTLNIKLINSYPDGGSQPRHTCTIATDNYDCQIQGVHLKHDETHQFGLSRGNSHQIITFQNSVLQYLPKSLIDAFPNIKLLNLNDLKIETIQPQAFSSAGKLEDLYLEGNRLTEFPAGVLLRAINLKTLVLTNNNINSLAYSFKNNAKLSGLYVDRNEITQLPSFDSISQLVTFNGSHNKLKEINNDQFARQTRIQSIDLSHNLIGKLDLQLPSSVLKFVDVSNNRLTSLTIPPNMEQLNSERNLLTMFDAGDSCYIKILQLANNKLELQPKLSSCRLLEYLDISNNLLEYFKFPSEQSGLKHLYLAHNNLFDILLPKKMSSALLTLDLSHNRIAYLPALTSFKSLRNLWLQNNNFIAIQGDFIPKQLNSLLVSDNEWNCNEVPKFAKLARDANGTYCGADFHVAQGICCKYFKKPFNEKLNEMVKEAHFHQQSNYKNLKDNCGHRTGSNGPDDTVGQFQRAASRLDKARADVLMKIQEATENREHTRQEFQAVKDKHAKDSNFKQSVALAIENKRWFYRVTVEGLSSNHEKLNRVINFVNERDTFNKNLLLRHKEETDKTTQSYEEKQEAKENLLNAIAQQKQEITDLKTLEKTLKKKMDGIQRQVNRNSPANHGILGEV